VRRLRFLLGSFLVALLLLGALEGVLRLARFHREASPVVIRFGYPDPREIVDLFQPDPRLFWTFRPGTVFDAESPVPINAGGFRGRMPADPRPAGLLRVAVMGDSVAFGAVASWPELLEEDLATALAERPAEVLNFGVPGYTVVQGLRQYEDRVGGLAPDVVIIAYGWNDHWLAHGDLPDAERRFPSRRMATLASHLTRLRVVQALHALLPSPAESAAPRVNERAVRRVSPEVFRRSLDTFVEQVRAAGARPVVVTLPSALTLDAFPPYLLDMGFTSSPEAAMADHRLYAGLAAQAAGVAGVAFVDLQPVLSFPEGAPNTDLFSPDRIHPTPEGQRLIAAALAPVIVGLLDDDARVAPAATGHPAPPRSGSETRP
jgi:lysophospholipase L1-like esterase